MAKKLKVYQTSVGFFDLAVAAPSMKAAAEAWGADPDIFKRGFAKPAENPKVVEAATAKPGVVLRRPVGSRGKFTEKTTFPTASEADFSVPQDRAKRPQASKKADTESAAKAERKAAASLKRERQREALDRAKAEAEREREKRRREKLIAKADSVFERARSRHESAMNAIRQQRRQLDKQEAREDEKWEREQQAYKASITEAQA